MRALPLLALVAACDAVAPAPVDAPVPPPAFVVSTPSEIAPGGALDLVIDTTLAEDDVVFVAISRGGVGAGPCPGLLGGGCLGIVTPALAGRVQVDATGRATFTGQVPSDVADGQVIAVQALAWDSLGRSIVLSNVATTEVVVPASGGGIPDPDPTCNPRTDADLCMARVPPGSFTMGCVAGRDDITGGCGVNETSTRVVHITRPMWVMTSEVTQRQWSAVFGNRPSWFDTSRGCTDGCPVETVSWHDALAFANAVSASYGAPGCYDLSACTGTPGVDLTCSAVGIDSPTGHPADCVGFRLPTEAEWEYASRAQTSQAIPGEGDYTFYNSVWYQMNALSTREVCTRTPNAFGLCDMGGNLAEWTWDAYEAAYPGGVAYDPISAVSSDRRTQRGGSWRSPPSDVRSAYRANMREVSAYNTIGFRLVRTAAP